MIYLNSNSEMLFFSCEIDSSWLDNSHAQRVVQAGIDALEESLGAEYVAAHVKESNRFADWNGGRLSNQAAMYQNIIAGRFIVVSKEIAGVSLLEVCDKAGDAMIAEIEKIEAEYKADQL